MMQTKLDQLVLYLARDIKQSNDYKSQSLQRGNLIHWLVNTIILYAATLAICL